MEVRRELEQQYQKLVEAHGLQDHKAIAISASIDGITVASVAFTRG